MAELTKAELDAAISRHAVTHLMNLLVARGVILPQDRDHIGMQTISTLMNFDMYGGIQNTTDPFYHHLRQAGLAG